MNGPIQSMMNPMSTYNMSLQFSRDARERRYSRASDLINERYYSSTSSKESKRDRILTQDTPVSLALEKRLKEMEKEFYRARTGNSSRTGHSFSFVKLIKSCLTGQ